MMSQKSAKLSSGGPKVLVNTNVTNPEISLNLMKGAMQYAEFHSDWQVEYHSGDNSGDPGNPGWEGLDGVVFASLNVKDMKACLEVQSPDAVVTTFGYFQQYNCLCVRSDDYRIGKQVAEYFLKRECYENFFFFSADKHMPSQLRFEGFAETLRESGIAEGSIWKMKNQKDVADKINTLNRPAAILSLHDKKGMQLLKQFETSGVAVPYRAAVVGVDNSEFICNTTRPKLSSVDCNYYEIGFQAAKLLDEKLKGQCINREILVPPKTLVERNSSSELPVYDPLLVRAMEYIREYACIPCNVEEMADFLGVAKRTLEYRFKKKMNRTPRSVIFETRMQHALYLLRNSNLTVEKVGERCGFPYRQHFYDAFSKRFNRTPASFRE